MYIEGTMLDGVVVDDAWSEVNLTTSEDVIADAVPTAIAPATMPAEDVVSFIEAYGGAWPQQREAIDVELLADVREGTGTIINCVEDDCSERCSLNAGGWPDADVTTHTLDLPWIRWVMRTRTGTRISRRGFTRARPRSRDTEPAAGPSSSPPSPPCSSRSCARPPLIASR